MLRTYRGVICSIAIGAVITIFAATAPAGTIIKLSPDSATSHIKFASNLLSTVDDLNAATTGEHNTAVDFQGFLDSIPDIASASASVTVSGITKAGSATVFPNQLMLQNFTGGTVSLYDAANTLLLSGSLKASTLAGSLGPTGANGALFTTSFNVITGGTLADGIDPSSLTFKMNIGGINEGAGLGAPDSVLSPFTANALLTITGELPVPEPGTYLLLAIGMAIASARMRGQRR
ncbi:MAG TPA: PEP-CTERM sorting domain-containing protein [Lacipirellulaceae bacterium]|nr:PEP-CTERM sorting domain-containing protein [Lacipirellulaceae bacterium]